jgi:hypothetical protein
VVRFAELVSARRHGVLSGPQPAEGP